MCAYLDNLLLGAWVPHLKPGFSKPKGLSGGFRKLGLRKCVWLKLWIIVCEKLEQWWVLPR